MVILLILSTIISITLLIAWLVIWAPGVNSRNALRLRVGMAEKEVEILLGSTGIRLVDDRDASTSLDEES